jgi:hypothetical protein
MRKLFATGAMIIAIGAAGLSPSLAQMGTQAGLGMGMMGGGCPVMGMMGQGMMDRGQGMGGFGMMGGNQGRMSAMAEGRLAYLKSELGITEAQIDSWNAYAEAAKSRVGMMQDMRKSMMDMMQGGTAIDRMDARLKGMQAMVETMNAMKPAIVKLYEVLTPDQKKIADDLIGMDCGAM